MSKAKLRVESVHEILAHNEKGVQIPTLSKPYLGTVQTTISFFFMYKYYSTLHTTYMYVHTVNYTYLSGKPIQSTSIGNMIYNYFVYVSGKTNMWTCPWLFIHNCSTWFSQALNFNIFRARPLFCRAHSYITAQIGRIEKGTKNLQGQWEGHWGQSKGHPRPWPWWP